MNKKRKPLRIDIAEQRIEFLEHNVAALMSALEFAMTHIQQKVASPIVGAEPKTVSLLDYYKVSMERKAAEAEAKEDLTASIN